MTANSETHNERATRGARNTLAVRRTHTSGSGLTFNEVRNHICVLTRTRKEKSVCVTLLDQGGRGRSLFLWSGQVRHFVVLL